MELCTSIEKMREVRTTLTKSQKPVGFVPTMGALHDGHLQLIHTASQEAEVIVSIFVNPTQFGIGEDLDRYPRDPEGDLEKCRQAGVKAVFMPSPGIMYPSDMQISFHVGRLNEQMCGASRPGHFEGVCQVVSKLFHIVEPDLAWFGQKDIQQYVILERMVRELNFPLDMRMVPTVRESDGLAMSSRNRYLTPEERVIAPLLYTALLQIRAALTVKIVTTDSLSEVIQQQRDMLTQAGFQIDYLNVYRKETLHAILDVQEGQWNRFAEADYQSGDHQGNQLTLEGLLVAGATWLGSTRLIDNIVLS